MTTPAHTPTPLPWRLASEVSDEYVYGPDGKQVANCCRDSRYWREAEANAALIVRAVNSFDALIAALSMVENRIATGEHIRAGTTPHLDIRAALALAEK